MSKLRWKGLCVVAVIAALGLLLAACGKEEKASPTVAATKPAAASPAATAPAAAPTATKPAGTPAAATSPAAAADPLKVRWDTFSPKMRELFEKNAPSTFKRPDPYKPIYGGVTRRGGSITTLGRNFVKMSNVTGWTIWGIVSGNLVAPQFGWGSDVSTGSGPPEGELAESWSSNKDGTEWTFKLRDNVFWQDKPPVNGRKVTGEDVKWYFETVKKEGWLAPEITDISSVEVPDPKTVVIKTSKPFPDMLSFLAAPTMAMAPKECYEKEADCMEKDPVGFGPFALKELKPTRVLLERNPKYPLKDQAGNPLPYLDGIEYIPIADAAALDANWRTGQVDWRLITDAPTYDAAKKGTPDLRLEFNGPTTTIALQGDWVVFNFEKKDAPWQDKRVRQALSLAIDRERNCDIATGGYCVMGSPINYGRDLGRPIDFSMKELQDLAPYYKYDPEKAKKLLADAGFPNGFTLDVQTGTSTKGMGAVEQWLEVFKDWEKIGVKVKHDANAEWSANLQKRTYPGIMGAGYALSGSRPYMQAYSLLHSKGAANFPGLNDPKLDAMLDEWRYLPLGSKERVDSSLKIFNYINEEMYRPTLWASPHWDIYQSWVINQLCAQPSCANVTMKAYTRTWLDPSVKGFPSDRKFEPRTKP
ncbi:MAG: ABC transporter substrate-binding protein [Chloroflexi bacterium]|nr:ABC transporter substrate-binding protein [Chloroflexota bacterium]